ncbi:DUF2141 domain-containing protein [Flaviaesturariibacter terrae]
MSRLLTLFLCLAIAARASAQSSIVAQLVNLRNDNGVCQVCLFDKAEAFRGKEGAPLQCQQVAISKRRAQATFSNLQPGTYAVFVFHDANRNRKFDTNFLGIPREGYGASRNNLPFAAAPTFDDNKLTLANHTVLQVTIRMRNL